MEFLKALLIWIFKPQNGPTEHVTTKPVEKPVETVQKPLRDRLYEKAKSYLGIDASPMDKAPDPLGCAESVNEIYKKCTGSYIASPGLSTIELFKAMRFHARFIETTKTDPGNIIICVTGQGNGVLEHGHVGICAKSGIMSNTSATGKWEVNYSYSKWYNYFNRIGGFRVWIFEPL